MRGLVQLDEAAAPVVSQGPDVFFKVPVEVRTRRLGIEIASIRALLYLGGFAADSAVLACSDHQFRLRELGGLLLIHVLAFRQHSGALAIRPFNITPYLHSFIHRLFHIRNNNFSLRRNLVGINLSMCIREKIVLPMRRTTSLDNINFFMNRTIQTVFELGV